MFCPDLKIDQPSHVTTTEICHVACFFFFWFKNTSNTTECISYNTTKLKKREWAEMDDCLAQIS